MHFLIIAKDGTDAQALERRMAAREAHIALGDEYLKKGNHLMAIALLNEQGQMCGSVMLVDFEDRAALDDWLEKEPYMTGKVWETIEVSSAKVGPSFEQFLPKK